VLADLAFGVAAGGVVVRAENSFRASFVPEQDKARHLAAVAAVAADRP
jgi:hypothetical protein